jgi:hypothetical protein
MINHALILINQCFSKKKNNNLIFQLSTSYLFHIEVIPVGSWLGCPHLGDCKIELNPR